MISYRVLVAVDHKLRGALEVYETLFDLEQKPMTKYDWFTFKYTTRLYDGNSGWSRTLISVDSNMIWTNESII